MYSHVFGQSPRLTIGFISDTFSDLVRWYTSPLPAPEEASAEALHTRSVVGVGADDTYLFTKHVVKSEQTRSVEAVGCGVSVDLYWFD